MSSWASPGDHGRERLPSEMGLLFLVGWGLQSSEEPWSTQRMGLGCYHYTPTPLPWSAVGSKTVLSVLNFEEEHEHVWGLKLIYGPFLCS